MAQLTKIVQEIGNGGHIYLPKEMVGKKVAINLVEKTIAEIEEDILNILRPYLKHILGIYLYGSYARHEQTPESDIDILVITESKIKIKKNINDYEIIASTQEQIENTINNNAPLILPILREAKPILNQNLIEKYKKEKLTRKNTKWYIETTSSSLKLAKYLIEEKDRIPNIVYPLILRLRGLYIIDLLIHNKIYSNKEIINYIVKKGISPDKAREIYRMYREHRDKKPISENSLNYDNLKKLYDIIYNYFQDVRSLWERLN